MCDRVHGSFFYLMFNRFVQKEQRSSSVFFDVPEKDKKLIKKKSNGGVIMSTRVRVSYIKGNEGDSAK